MTREVLTARRAAGAHAIREPYRLPIDVAAPDLLLARRAIYFAYTDDRCLHYVGKVDRRVRAGALGRRLGEHLRTSERKRRVWRWLWVIELSEQMPVAELLGLERSLIRAFQPPGNIQHRWRAA